MRRSNGWSLDYVRVGAKLPARLSSPEGVCFTKHSMYVVRWVRHPNSSAQQRRLFLQDARAWAAQPLLAVCAACCSAGAAAIARFPWDAESGEFAALAEVFENDMLDYSKIPGRAMVPGRMTTGPDGNLFLAVDVDHTVRSTGTS